MAFIAFTTDQILAGEANKQELWTKTKDNFDDHESRIVTLEGGGAIAYPSFVWRFEGEYDLLSTPIELVTRYRAEFNLKITGAVLMVHEAGTSGTTEIDIEKFNAGGGGVTSLFSTRPSIGFASGNDAVSTNQVLDTGVTSLTAGQFLRCKITSSQSGPDTSPQGTPAHISVFAQFIKE